jgi:hypothetical protein
VDFSAGGNIDGRSWFGVFIAPSYAQYGLAVHVNVQSEASNTCYFAKRKRAHTPTCAVW